MATQPHAVGDVLRGALGALRHVVPYDLAVIYDLDGETLRARVAEGPLADRRVAQHQLELARFPTIQRALQTRRPIPLEAHHHASDEGDPYDGVLDLPEGHSCMVVPLFAADRTLGLITLDRGSCGIYPSDVVELAGVYGQLISIALAYAQQAQLLDRYRHRLREEHRLLKHEVRGPLTAATRVESSRETHMQAVARMAHQVAPSDLTVLIRGETGAGKEVLAEAIHEWSARVDGPFVKLNCAAIPDELVESELFGHVKGAFSGAERDRTGRFATAHGGTLLLDEIGDMPLSAQAKLLRVLQEGTFEPVGSDRPTHADVRVIAATNTDLRDAIEAGKFREDLYYRIATFPIELPPLRQRPADIVPIARQILAEIAQRHGGGPWRFTAGAEDALRVAPWPGNIRQLRNALERACILHPRGEIEPEHLGLSDTERHLDTRTRTGHASTAGDPLAAVRGAPNLVTFEESQRLYFEEALRRTGGKIYGDDGAAALVGLKPTTLQSKLKKLGIRGSSRHEERSGTTRPSSSAQVGSPPEIR